MTAMNITDNPRKKALLLHLAGEAVYDIFLGLVVADVPADADQDVDNVYTTAKHALNAHFNPKRNIEYEIYTRKSHLCGLGRMRSVKDWWNHWQR